MAGKKDPVRTEATRQKLLEAGYDLFARKNIESVSLSEITAAAGYGPATMYRYFSSKPEFVVAVSAWKIARVWEENRDMRPKTDLSVMTAREVLENYLDFFIELYLNHRDALCFNQLFNIYVRSEHIDAEMISPYEELVRTLEKRFRVVSEKAAADHTVRTDVPEKEMFRATLHLMLAAVTRYAVGLVFRPESEEQAVEELETLKRALLREYCT
ncbi:MAG: TetR/AcrR family transcriptional regulator [Clostridia bacterium]|nr:TetR/AcrR family transcriptional regulator [Clostridia bacterium]